MFITCFTHVSTKEDVILMREAVTCKPRKCKARTKVVGNNDIYLDSRICWVVGRTKTVYFIFPG